MLAGGWHRQPGAGHACGALSQAEHREQNIAQPWWRAGSSRVSRRLNMGVHVMNQPGRFASEAKNRHNVFIMLNIKALPLHTSRLVSRERHWTGDL
jgi:hypothetical protein